MAKRLGWRCKSIQQQKDKARIYNSKEWKALRIAKLRANTDCEICKANGHIRSAHCVHHIHPIEDSSTFEEMKRWAFDWNNLQSLCDECHHQVHEEIRSFTRETKRQRNEQRRERWMNSLVERFTGQAAEPEPKTPAPVA